MQDHDPYGEKEYSIKPNNDKIKIGDNGEIHIDNAPPTEDINGLLAQNDIDNNPGGHQAMMEHMFGQADPETDALIDEMMTGRRELEARIASGRDMSLFGAEDESSDPLEALRKLALSLNPKHGDKLYPLETLGVYHVVQSGNMMMWDFSMGNPEKFIDDRIVEFMNQVDVNRFKNRLERELEQNPLIKEGFRIRLNYAYLLEEGTDDIQVKTSKKQELLFCDGLDAEGNYTGTLESAQDLTNEDLDEMANEFYSNSETIEETKTGTPNTVRLRIKQLMDEAGMVMIEDLDSVYDEVRKFGQDNLEESLITRIAYLVFVSEIDPQNPLLE